MEGSRRKKKLGRLPKNFRAISTAVLGRQPSAVTSRSKNDIRFYPMYHSHQKGSHTDKRKMSKDHSLTENTDIRACPDKRFCFFSAIKRSRKTRNERQKAHLFHTRKIFQPKNQRLRLKDFAGCIKFTLSSTTPPCASLAIAFPSLSGICRTNLPICDFERLRANGTPLISGLADHTSRLAIATNKKATDASRASGKQIKNYLHKTT